MSAEELLARRAEIDPRARARLRYRLAAPSPIPEARVTENFDQLLDRIETSRHKRRVELRDGEPYRELVITAQVEIDGKVSRVVATLDPNAYPEVVDRVERLTAEALVRQIIEERRS